MAILQGKTWSIAPRPDGKLYPEDGETFSAEPYDLTAGGARTVPFSYNWPTEPNITSEATVTPATFSSNFVNGRRLYLTAGSYGDITMSGSDRELVLTTGVVIGSINIANNVNRIKISANPVRSGTIARFYANPATGLTDIMINGVNVVGTATYSSIVLNSLTRFACINSRIEMPGSPSFIRSDTDPNVDVIYANNELITNADSYGTRHHNIVRSIIVDNRMVTQGRHTYRIHAPYLNGFSDNIFVENNQLETGGIQCHAVTNGADGFVAPTPTNGMGTLDRVYFYNNRMYYNGNSGTFQPGYVLNGYDSRVLRLTLVNNDLYTTGDVWLLPGEQQPAWTVSGNTEQAYQAPPAWSFN